MITKTVNKIRISVSYGVNKEIPENMKNMNAYTVILKFGRKQLTTEYYTGYGWTREPNQKDVLSCLLMDSSSYRNSRDFEDFCSEFGYDSDSRTAEKIYKQCGRIAEKLKRFLGDEYETIEDELAEY